MINTALPSWWIDIERSRFNALAELDAVMEVMERTLAESDNQSSHSLQINLSRWSELVTASLSAAGSLQKSARLAESRRKDVLVSGFAVPGDTGYTDRAAEASRRLRSLVSETRIQMTRINDELTRRQPRRPQMRLYRDNSPSLVDVHV